jgi:hypothetical protein
MDLLIGDDLIYNDGPRYPATILATPYGVKRLHHKPTGQLALRCHPHLRRIRLHRNRPVLVRPQHTRPDRQPQFTRSLPIKTHLAKAIYNLAHDQIQWEALHGRKRTPSISS